MIRRLCSSLPAVAALPPTLFGAPAHAQGFKRVAPCVSQSPVGPASQPGSTSPPACRW